jgi:hypothetical protein
MNNVRIRQLRNLSINERQLLMTSLLLLPLTGISLHIFGLKRTRSAMSHLSNRSREGLPEADQMNVAKQVARMVSIAANHGPYHANCLKRSVLIWWLLEQKGIHTEIRIGAQKDPSGLQAHAWVEFKGDVLNDYQDIASQFAPFESLLFPDNLQFL